MSHYLLCNTIPKSGTNLILQMVGATKHINHRTMGAAGNPRRSFQEIGEEIMDTCIEHHRIVGHIPYSDGLLGLCRSLGIKMILLARHPGDVIVSHMEHVKKFPTSTLNYNINGVFLAERPDPIDDLMDNIVQRYWDFLGWKYAKDYPVLYLTYEDLQLRLAQSILKIRTFAPLVFKYEPLLSMVSRIDPNESPTFRKGLVGDWVNVFTKEQKERFDNLEGMKELLKALEMEER